MELLTYVSGPDHTLVASGPVLIQVRRGELTVELISRMESIARLVRTSTGALALLSIVECDAPIASEEARRAQADVMARLSAERGIPVAVVSVDQGGLGASVRSMSVRRYNRAGARVAEFNSVEAGAKWLADGLDLNGPALFGAAERARLIDPSEPS